MKTDNVSYVIISCAAILSILAASASCSAAPIEFMGQLSTWHREAAFEGERRYSSGIRYIPRLEILKDFGGGRIMDLEASLNAWAALGDAEDTSSELHRLKLRFATARTETRLGLQVINFGPAYILRPLRWFDRLDPRDALQLTDGVYALRFKYVAQNNANLWLWALYGNDELKGYETMRTAEEKPEFGGRVQSPLGPGELALTFHNRKVDPPFPLLPQLGESRFALDGRWDVKVGLWFESVLQRLNGPGISTSWIRTATVGADYTLGLGNGLHVLCEHMAASVTTDEPMLGPGRDTNVTAILLGYPAGYLDYFTAIGFYDWESDEYYQYFAWKRTWDTMVLDVSLFHYPASEALPGRSISSAGTGLQIMMIFNH
jgi:hypothetical protein